MAKVLVSLSLQPALPVLQAELPYRSEPVEFSCRQLELGSAASMEEALVLGRAESEPLLAQVTEERFAVQAMMERSEAELAYSSGVSLLRVLLKR
jgi:hypothetical protein